jgi:hypothetical protein
MFRFVFIVLLAVVVSGCGEVKTVEHRLFSPPGPTDLPEPCHAFGAAPEELVEKGCVFPYSFPYPGKAENLLRIALDSKTDQFTRLDDAEIVTDGIVLVEFVNNSGGPQALGWSGDFCEGTRVEIAGSQATPHRAIELRGPLHALRQTDVIRRFVDIRQNRVASEREPLWALPDGCHDTHFFFWNQQLKEQVRLCYTGEAAVKQVTDMRVARSCDELNPVPQRAPVAPLSIRSWPFAVPPEFLSDVNVLSDDQISPLSWAAARGDSALVTNLLERGAFADADAVVEAAVAGHGAVVGLLLERGARIDADTIARVAASGNAGLVRQLIENAQIENDQYRLVWAVRFGEASLVRDLLKTGGNARCADIAARYVDGKLDVLSEAEQGQAVDAATRAGCPLLADLVGRKP